MSSKTDAIQLPKGAQYRIFSLCLILWFVTACVFIFLLLVVAPGRGAGWVVDDGLFLANAWSVAHGGKLDGMLPQEPVYLINALMIKLGIRELLHFRYAYYFLSFTSAAVFFIGLDRRRFMSPMIPVAVGAALLIAFSSVLPMYFFFLFGAGCYFFSEDAVGWKKELLLSLSGILLAIAGFMHAAILIAMLLLVFMILVSDKSTRKSLFAFIFVSTSLVLWGGYIESLGIEKLLATPAGHNASLGHLLSSVGRIIWYFCSIGLVYIAVVILFKKLGRRKYAAAQIAISVVVTAYFFVKFFSAQFDIFHGTVKLSEVIGQFIDVPGIVFCILLLVFFRWIGEFCFDVGLLHARSMEGDYSSRKTTNRGLIRERGAYVISSIQANGAHRNLLLAVSGLFLVAAGYAAGSVSPFAICLSAFSAPVLGTAFILWESLDSRDRGYWQFYGLRIVLLIAWLAIFCMYAATVNLPTLEPIITNDRVTLRESPLKGIEEQPQYQKSLLQLLDVYKKNGCQNVSFVTLDYVPMVYFILRHSLPNEFGIVRPMFYFPEEKLQRELNVHKGWCVLDVTTNETQTLINTRMSDNRANLRGRIQEESQRVFLIPSPSDGISELHLYVRDAARVPSD